MRADRLVATLLLLQARGTVTAPEVAAELEVSERTARRDLDALAVAGIPVYSQQGRGGGWRLIGGARTDLTGLRSAEARALLTMAVASGQATPEFTSAMRKLTQALPAPIRAETELAMSSVLADRTSWHNREQSSLAERRRDDCLEPLQDAISQRQIVVMTYDTPRKGRSSRPINPLGLVVKGGLWYLLADSGDDRRSFRVDRIVELAGTNSTFEPPTDFDLATAWDDITMSYSERSSQLMIDAIALDRALPTLRALGVDTTIHEPVPSSTGGAATRVTLAAWNAEMLATQIAGLMGVLELIDPPDELVLCLREIGRSLTVRFGVESLDRRGGERRS